MPPMQKCGVYSDSLRRLATRVRDPIKFKKCCQLFVAMYDKPFPVVAVCVSHEDCSTVGINRCNIAPAPTPIY
jgi:hypothetical protein